MNDRPMRPGKTSSGDAWPLLPRASSIDAVRSARWFLERLEETFAAELSQMARELDVLRVALEHAETRTATLELELAILREEKINGGMS